LQQFDGGEAERYVDVSPQPATAALFDDTKTVGRVDFEVCPRSSRLRHHCGGPGSSQRS
jgi:hypothetical protein